MKLDDFEKYVNENKLDFGPDHEVPDVWEKVEKRAPQEIQMRVSWRRWAARAASVIVIFTLSYFIHDFRANWQGDESVQIANQLLDDPRFQQLLEADEYYTAEINYKKEELFRLASNVPGLESEINTDLADLDAVLTELKEDLGDNADNEEVIEAMMQNYRLKLEILEDMLEQFNNKQNKSNNHEEGISI
jgi:hypothetical protein